jgi:hypothetical protein
MTEIHWGEALYQRVYSQVHTMLAERRRRGESAEKIREHLEWEYELSGINWIGKGEVWEITQEATVAAFEAFLAAWDDEADASQGFSS